MKEKDMILALHQQLKTSNDQLNQPLSSDAEVIRIQEGSLAVSIDELSSEDGFSAEDPFLLGWNVVCAVNSDLLAVGADPKFMVNALTISQEMNDAWMQKFSKGMQEALDSLGSFMIGGDIGVDSHWRFCGSVIGTFEKEKPFISRKIPIEKGVVIATGSFGDGNYAARRFWSKFKDRKSIEAIKAIIEFPLCLH